MLILNTVLGSFVGEQKIPSGRQRIRVYRHLGAYIKKLFSSSADRKG